MTAYYFWLTWIILLISMLLLIFIASKILP